MSGRYCSHNHSDKSRPYLEKIKKECKKIDVKLELSYANRLGIFNMIKLVKEVIIAEENNYIYVNVASGSKIQAIACMMACMILKECKNIQPFYAEPETYAAFEGKQHPLDSKIQYPYQYMKFKYQIKNFLMH